MNKFAYTLLSASLFFTCFFPGQTLAAVESVQAYGIDTVAGYETILKTTTTLPGQNITFQVEKPDGTKLNFDSNSGSDGVARFTLSDYHTHSAGVYNVAASLSQNSDLSQSSYNSFVVFPDKISPDQSTVNIDKTVVQPDGQDFASISVVLVDKFGNPIKNHFIQVISNRHDLDSIQCASLDCSTNASGALQFSVSSGSKGVSEYRVFDSTTGVFLNQKVSVAFVAGNDYLSDAGGPFPFFIDTARAASGTLHHFDISGLPANIQPNQNVSFIVTAMDDANQTVQNYSGKVHFSSSGDNSSNVTLPEDYTFKAEDLGAHQFSLGLSFLSAGSYTFGVTDLTNTLIQGTKTVQVGANPSPTQQGGNLNITLTSPVSGTYSQKTQVVSGNALAGSTVKIYDNQQEIGNVQATNDGKYSLQTPPLQDGQHSVYSVMLDNTQTAKGTSNTVNFSIDTTPPAVLDLSLEPTSGIKPGTPVTIKVTSEENLSQAAVVFNGDIITLHPSLDNAGVYVATLQAPSTPGVYPIDVLLVDQLSNEGSYKSKAQVTVSNEGGTVTTQEGTQQATQQTTQEFQPATQEQTQQVALLPNTPPSKVTGLYAYTGARKVTLVWDAASDNETFVKHYRVYFGTDPRNLDHNVDTKDASTTWYVPNLENGKEYYFAVTAFDSDALESAGLSEVVSAIPYGTGVSNLGTNASGIPAGQHSAASTFVTPSTTPKTGPELLLFLAGSGIVGEISRRLRRKNKK